MAMTTSYSQLKLNSPWRWAPVVCGPLMFVVLGIVQNQTGNAIGLNFVPFLLIPLTFYWMRGGSANSFGLARDEARHTGRVRVNSRPILAISMMVVGAAMVAAYVVVMYVLDHGPRERTGLESLITSIGFVIPGLLFIANGWERPWDLKVVERDAERGAT